MAVPTYFFLDTEWADEPGVELVILALVSEDGMQEFYAEREHLPRHPTAFVQDRVYPLLDRGETILSDEQMTSALLAFLGRVALPFVLADFPNDLELLQYVLDGFPVSGSNASHRSTALVTTLMCRDDKTTALLERWFTMHPREAARRHHALVDARALRMAWLAATGRPGGEWKVDNVDD
jgi:hypothetical protein